MAKKKIRRLNKPWYVEDEYGRDDSVLVNKVNELIGIVNYQQEVIKSMEVLLKESGKGRRR